MDVVAYRHFSVGSPITSITDKSGGVTLWFFGNFILTLDLFLFGDREIRVTLWFFVYLGIVAARRFPSVKRGPA
jgi:hypothetical protein